MADDKQEVQSGEAEEAKTEEKTADESQMDEKDTDLKEVGTPAPDAKVKVMLPDQEEESVSVPSDGTTPDTAGPKEVDTSKLSDTANKVLDQVSEMTILELAELVKVMEDKFGVSAAPAAVAVADSSAGGDAAQAEEKSSYNVKLVEAGPNKIGAIKAVRAITALGLKEAKDMVEAAPTVIKEDVKKEEAEEMKKQLEEAGAKAELI